MKNLKNEHGYTLVLVLLTVTIMFPIGALLIHANLNSTRQIQSTEVYRSSVAMAEMGLIFAEAKINYIQEAERAAILPPATDNEEEVLKALADKIEQAFSQLEPEDFEGQKYKIEIKETYIVTGDEGSELVVTVESIGSTEVDYKITSDIVISSPNLTDLIEGGGGGEPVPDPEDILPPTDPSSVFVENYADVYRRIDVATDSTSRNITLNYGESLIEPGDLRTISFNLQGENDVEIGRNFFSSSGGITQNGRLRNFEVKGNLGSSTHLTFTGTNFTVRGDIGMSNNLTLNNSISKIYGYSALNRLTVDGGSLDAQNFRPSELTATNNARVLIRGSLMTEWGGSNINNGSRVTIWGHVVGEAPVHMRHGSDLIVHGNADFTGIWNYIQFTGVGSRVLIYGELLPQSPEGVTVEIERGITSDQCPIDPNRNRICVVTDRPPTTTTPPTDGGETTPPTTPPTINPDDVIINVDTENITYQGIQR